MAAPVAGFVQLPTDAGNTGKKVRTQTRVVGADTVHEHHFVPISVRKIDGLYYATSAVLSSQAAAHNQTTTAHAWLELPVGGTKRARLRDIFTTWTLGAAVGADVTALYRGLVVARFTFTGTASGAIITPAKRSSLDVANVANLRTASTGMTVTAGALAFTLLQFGFIDWTAVVTSGAPATFTQHENGPGKWDPAAEDDFLDFGPGEGIVFYQPDAGATTFRMVLSATWDEYDNA